MAGVTICPDIGAPHPPKKKSVTVSIVFPRQQSAMKWWDRMPWSPFFECWVLSQLFHFPFSLSSRGSLVPLHNGGTIRVVSSAYLRLLIFLPAILIPACASSSPALLMMYSAYKLNKQGDNIQPWRTPFPIWNQSIVPWWLRLPWWLRTFLVAQTVKCLPTMRETRVQSLG